MRPSWKWPGISPWGTMRDYDGCGYPRALAGDTIPLSARIMALADVYDALTSRRVYKEAFSHDFAKSTIPKDAAHYDPFIVEAFFAEEQQFVAIREQLRRWRRR